MLVYMNINAIKKIERAARSDNSIISLGQGIPGKKLDARIQQHIIEVVQSGKADEYSDPQGLPELRRAITRDIQQDDMAYSEDEIVITAGAMEALSVVLRSVVGSTNNEVIVPTPVYAAYFEVIKSARGIVREVKLNPDSNWKLDINELKRAIKKQTAAILLCNPNNPTGAIYDKKELEQVAELAKEQGITLIIDEVYRNMLYDQSSILYSPAMNARYKKSVVRLMSFSKDFSLTGWRIGYIQADSNRIEKLVAIHDTLVNCAPVISQYAACHALQYSKQILQENRIMYGLLRSKVAVYLDEIPRATSYVLPEGGYFFFVRLHNQSAGKFTEQLFKQQKVAIVPGDSFGSGCSEYIRICFGRKEEDIDEAMKRIVKFFDVN